MTRILLVYYSQTGRTSRIARLICAATGCDTERLEPLTPFSGSQSDIRKQITSNPHIPIRELVHDINQYGTVILGMPVWDNDIPPPMLSFINTTDWNGIKIHPFFTTGGVYVNVYSSLKDKCRGASISAPLFLIFDNDGVLADVKE